jgi:hydroxymethylbilane synthase
MPALRIGARGSALALWQARHVADRLAVASELIEVRTSGDLLSDVPLSSVAGKAFFTKEIEDALLAGTIDLAVHSLKDLATTLPTGLTLGAVLAREDPRDVLIGREPLASGARIGTSSLRRRAFLARWRPDLRIVELRGNVPTRIERLDRGDFEAIVLAAAGVRRLGLADRVAMTFPAETLPPAAGQGAIAVQIRAGDGEARRAVEALNDVGSEAETAAERALLRRLEGGCQVPVGALARVEGTRVSLFGAVCSLDGRRAVEGRRDGHVAGAEVVGTHLAEELLERGGEAILDAIRGPAP